MRSEGSLARLALTEKSLVGFLTEEQTHLHRSVVPKHAPVEFQMVLVTRSGGGCVVCFMLVGI